MRRASVGAGLHAGVPADTRLVLHAYSVACRREEELERYHKELEREVPLSMTPDFRYSDAFIRTGGGGGRGSSRALTSSSGGDGSGAELSSSGGSDASMPRLD